MSAVEYARYAEAYGGLPFSELLNMSTSTCGSSSNARRREENFYALTFIRSSIRSRRDNSCAAANNAVCDEPTTCAAGTDDTDCGGRTCNGDDSCSLAKNGVCNSPNSCASGTDVSDCCGSEEGDDSCATANNGACEEPSACAAGTDTSDCGGSSTDGGVPEADFTNIVGNQDGTSSCEWRFNR